MMRQNLTELLTSAASASYGSFYGTVLAALTSRSRATLAELHRALPNLSSADARLALVTLLQQHLVNHYTDEHGSTFYEPNWEQAYNFTCRLPTLHKLIEDRYGEDVAKVFHSVAQAGVISVGELIAQSFSLLHDKSSNHDEPVITEGHNAVGSATDGAKEKVLYGILSLLLATGHICRVNARQFWPKYDRDLEAVHETAQSQFPTGASIKKERDSLRAESDKLLRQWRCEEETFDPSLATDASQTTRKRGHAPDFPDAGGADGDRRSKRRQIQAKVPIAIKGRQLWMEQHQQPLHHELAIAVNFDRCAVGLRTDTFVRHCERHLSEPTAKVYSALLHTLEASITRCYDPLRPKQEERKFFEAEYQQPLLDDIGLSQSITTREIANTLDANVDLDQLASELEDDIALSIEGATADAVTAPALADQEDGTSPLASRLQKVQQHLGTLSCDPHGYIQTFKGEWSVPFHAVTQRIIENEIESIITHTLGTLAARMIRVLKYYGYQELKHLASRAMVTEDQARSACTSLQQAGWIEVVELPRTARREVTKSMWLWSYDVLKARQKCLADCYFAMSRLSIRLQQKRQEIQRVVDKSERTDVQGNEDKFLSQEEKEVLAKFEKQTDIVIRQLIRLDELVAIMRDLSPMEYPHKLWDPSWIDWRSSSEDASDAKAEDDEAEGDRGLDDLNDEDTAVG